MWQTHAFAYGPLYHAEFRIELCVYFQTIKLDLKVCFDILWWHDQLINANYSNDVKELTIPSISISCRLIHSIPFSTDAVCSLLSSPVLSHAVKGSGISAVIYFDMVKISWMIKWHHVFHRSLLRTSNTVICLWVFPPFSLKKVFFIIQFPIPSANIFPPFQNNT